MSALQTIQNVLEQTARRRRFLRAWRGLWQGLLIGAVVWLTALLLFKVLPIPVLILPTAGGLGLAAALAGFGWGWWRKPSLFETARWLDREQNLSERLSTALEIAAIPGETAWSQLVVADAAQAVAKVQAKQLLPIALPRISRWTFLLLVIAAGLGFVPEYRTKTFVKARNEAQTIKETGKQLAELTRRNLAQRPPALDQTKQALEQVSELGDQLAKATLTRSEALKELASVTEKIQQQTREMSKTPAFKAVEKAARASSKGGTTSSAELQKQIEALQKELGNQKADLPSLEKIKNDLEKAKEAASNLPDKNSPDAQTARNNLDQKLAELAKQAKELGLNLPSLTESIEALRNSEIDKVLKDLNVAEVDLEKMEAMAKALEQLEKQSAQAGKNLAEQLENGQMELAQDTLQKMMETLQKGNLTPEELQKLLSELSKATPVAAQFGKAGDMLKEGAKLASAGKKGDAAQKLADAAKELANAAKEMGDAQSMLATMDALQRAQMSIANGQAFASTKSRMGAPGTSRGGVGTWTDENSWQYPEFVDKWDNSGVAREDTDPRGHSDRGDGQLSDNLLPTRVKGSMTPGGPMPSITLKGVSIKGVSKVQYQEVVGAAQNDAQSALSQDQVPRAYKGAVRDYFNDLKE
jgi:hypothetical protein